LIHCNWMNLTISASLYLSKNTVTKFAIILMLELCIIFYGASEYTSTCGTVLYEYI
jgi:hypothetical protein